MTSVDVQTGNRTTTIQHPAAMRRPGCASSKGRLDLRLGSMQQRRGTQPTSWQGPWRTGLERSGRCCRRARSDGALRRRRERVRLRLSGRARITPDRTLRGAGSRWPTSTPDDARSPCHGQTPRARFSRNPSRGLFSLRVARIGPRPIVRPTVKGRAAPRPGRRSLMQKHGSRWIVATVAVFALVTAACGSDSDNEPNDGGGTTGSTTATVRAPTPTWRPATCSRRSAKRV